MSYLRYFVGLGLLVMVSMTEPMVPRVYAHDRKELQWVTGSVEYVALCRQTYRTAWKGVQNLAQGVDADWVVVLDVDETVLSNAQYQQERAALGLDYSPDSWAEWVLRKEAVPVPGAKGFVDRVRTLGDRAHITFLTNRMLEREDATIANLKKYGLFQDGDIILSRKNKADTKVVRRRCLTSGTGRCEKYGPLVILATLGDNIRDFLPVRGMDVARKMRATGVGDESRWGRAWFMLPNPMYGSWQRDYK